MSFARIKTFTHTSIWRSTLAFTFIMLLVCGGLLFSVYELLLLEQKRSTQERVFQGVQAFLDLAAEPGMTQIRFIRDVQRRARSSSEKIIVMQVNKDIFGNLAVLPSNVKEFPETSRFAVAVSEFSGRGDIDFALGTKVETAFGTLVIGVFEPNTAVTEQRYLIASVASLSGLVLLLLLIGYLYNRRVLARLSDISRLMEDVEKGKLDTRLPVSKREDEYDTISAQINQMLQTIREQVDAISSVTDSIAHDLRTPLGRIRLSLEDLSSDIDDERLLQMLEDVDQLIQTFNAMLELSRLEKGALDIEKHNCSFSTICADAASLAEALLEDTQQLSIDIEEGIAIEGNEHLLFRAVYNLLENAIQYSGSEGKIQLNLKQSANAVITLSVSDNGPGIPETEREKIFQRLYRLDKSRSAQGYGMGLALVKAIVNEHRGKISLRDTQANDVHPGLTVELCF